MPTVHRERAPAKLSRSLAVVGVRADGYHLLESEMVTLDLADEVEISESESPSQLVVVDEVAWCGAPAPEASPAVLPASGPGGVGLLAGRSPLPATGPSPAVPSDGSNLVLRALSLVDRRASVRLTKRIPAAAGLGGGSADAAAVLRWAGGAGRERGAELGADVPFCVVGGRAMVGGIGDEVVPLPPLELAVVLVTPCIAVSTGLVYQAWDALGGPRGDGPNDLEAPALVVAPRLGWWRDLLASVAGRPPALAGSGSTWFFECDGAAAAASLAGEIRGAVGEAGERAMVAACAGAP